MERRCEIGGCQNPHTARGMCSMHYDRWRRYGDPLTSGRQPRPVCRVEGCESPSHAHQMCNKHVWRWRRYGDPEAPSFHRDRCSLCDGKHLAHGLCRKHFERFRRHGDPYFDGKTFVLCGIPTCTNPATNSPEHGHLCRNHRYRLKTFGDPMGTATRVKAMGIDLRIEPLLDVIAARGGLAAVLAAAGIDPQTSGERYEKVIVWSLREKGGVIDAAHADLWAVNVLGTHPALVWGDDWWDHEAMSGNEWEEAAA